MMIGVAGRRDVLRLTGLAMLFCAFAAAAAPDGHTGHERPVAGGYELSLFQPTATQRISPEFLAAPSQKFVQIEVTAVDNPGRLPVSFSVHFQPVQGERTYLGSFSLYPPDNPGKFIVATRGQLRAGGSVVVTLVPLASVSGKEHVQLRARLKPLTFVAE